MQIQQHKNTPGPHFKDQLQGRDNIRLSPQRRELIVRPVHVRFGWKKQPWKRYIFLHEWCTLIHSTKGECAARNLTMTTYHNFPQTPSFSSRKSVAQIACACAHRKPSSCVGCWCDLTRDSNFRRVRAQSLSLRLHCFTSCNVWYLVHWNNSTPRGTDLPNSQEIPRILYNPKVGSLPHSQQPLEVNLIRPYPETTLLTVVKIWTACGQQEFQCTKQRLSAYNFTVHT